MAVDIGKALREIEEDCRNLEKHEQLTEYARGQLDLIKLIKNEFETNEKYTVSDITKYPNETRVALTNLMLANELSNLCHILKNKLKRLRSSTTTNPVLQN